ncbi:MAG: OmpA family protein [Nanoarchaeota archaeon]|nr:OmpA family protein [Nanoarchaeota archaeon]
MSMESSAGRRIFGVILLIFIFGLAASIVVYVVKPWKQKKLEKETGSESQYKKETTGRADNFPSYSIFRSKETREGVKKDSIKLTIEDDSKDPDMYFSRMKALKNGDIDWAVFTIDSFLTAGIVGLKGEFPGTIVLPIDVSIGADAMLVKGDIKSIEELNRPDTRFVLIKNSPSEFLTRFAIAYFNLSNIPKDCMIEAESAEDVYNRFRKDSGSAPRVYVMWEPFVSKAVEAGGKIVFSSEKLKDGIFDVLVVSRKFLKENPSIVKSVVESYLSAAYFYKDSMVDLVIEDAKLLGRKIERKDAENIVKRLRLKNTLESYAHFGLLSKEDSKGLDNMEDIISMIADVLIATGAFSQSDFDKVQISSLFNKDILETLKREGFRPSKLDSLVVGDTESLGQVRGDVELPELTDEQWNSLIPVGKMKIEPIEFRRGTSELWIQSKRDLDELSSKLGSMPYYYLLVTGNARAEGDIEANKVLAEERAKAVVEYLVLECSVSRNRIKAIAATPSSKGAEAQSVAFQLGQTPY